jgi:filamentous hemagglutinin family protein
MSIRSSGSQAARAGAHPRLATPSRAQRTPTRSPQSLRLTLLSHALLGAGLLSPVLGGAPVRAQGLPTGLQVVSGQASVLTQGSQMTVRNSANAILNWQSFSVGAGRGVHFDQASAASKVLNRVTGGEASQILGSLTSNGQVWLLNPSGVLFGRDARVDVHSLVVSTLRLADSDFLGGRYRFTATGGEGTVRNQGVIGTSLGGQVVLIGPGIENAGSVQAPGGSVALASGTQVDLVDTGMPNLAVRVAVPAGQALNTGALSAAGGRVDVFGAVVNQQGVIRADSAGLDSAGRVVLSASESVSLAAGSQTSADGAAGGSVTVDAGAGAASVAGGLSAQGAGGQGGRIDVLGARVELADAARLDASGTLGGGRMRVGGGLQGQEADVANAQHTTVAAGAQLLADARTQGDGGRVIVWADDTARVHGSISARGGPQGGDGGFIETSGKRMLEVTRAADASAPAGRGGTWLLDPNDITIGSTDSNITGGPNYVSTGNSATVSAGTISLALSLGTSVSVTTGAGGTPTEAGDITVASAISKSGDADATLTLNAYRNINLNNSIIAGTGIGKLNLTLHADTGGSGTGRTYLRTATVGLNGGVLAATSNGGRVTLVDGNTFTFNSASATIGQLDLAGGTLSGSGDVTVTGAVNFTGGNVTLSGSGTLTTQGTTTLNMPLSDRWFAVRGTRHWVNQGTFNMTGDDYWVTLDNARFTNASGASFIYTGADPTTPSGNPQPGTPTVSSIWTNNGTVRIASSNPLQDSSLETVTFNNTGTLYADTRFAIRAPGTDSGSYVVASGSRLILESVNRTYDAAARISGAGTLAIQSSATQTMNGAIDIGRFEMTGGTLNGTGSLTVRSNFSRTGGTLGTGFSGIDVTQATGDLAPGALQAGTITLATRDPASTMLLDAGVSSVGNMTLNAAGKLQVLATPTAGTSVAAGGDQVVTAGALLVRGAPSGNSRAAWLRADGSQSITAQTLQVQGGESGQQSFGYIQARTGSQTIKVSGDVNVLGGAGGEDNYAVINGQNQTLTIGGDLTLRGQSGAILSGGVGSYARIGASNLDATTPVSLNLSVGGSLILAGGSASGAGAVLGNVAASRQPLNLTLAVGGNITMSSGSATGVPVSIGRFDSNTVPSGNLTISAPNGTLTTGAGTGLNPGGTLTVSARALDLAGSATGTSVALSGSAGATLRNGTTIVAREGGTNPLIVDAGGGAFVNQAGSGVFSIPAGTRWLVYSNNPDSDTMGGLVPDFKQYGAFYPQTAATGTGNGALYRQAQTTPSDAPANTTTVAVATALTSVSVPTQMSTPTRGRVLDAVPALSGTTTTGGVDEITATEAAAGGSGSSASGGSTQVAFRSVSLGRMTRAELQTLLTARAEYKKKVFASALNGLEVNPALADVRACENEAELEGGDCLVTEELKKYVQETREVRKLARESRRTVRQAAVPQIERKVAVLIGNDNYADRNIPTLENARADAQAVGKLLQDTLGYDTVMLTDASKQSVIRTLNRLALETGPNDSVIVYYAGHGEAIENGKTGYWIMNDSSADRPQSWLSNGDVSRLLGRISARQLMLVSDSCFSGAFAGAERVTRPDSPDAEKLLSRKAAVVMSSGGNEPVSDDGREGHSSFAWHFMDLLRKVSDWNLGVSVFETLKVEVSKDVPQTPQYGASRFAGHEGNTDYLFERREVEKR